MTFYSKHFLHSCIVIFLYNYIFHFIPVYNGDQKCNGSYTGSGTFKLIKQSTPVETGSECMGGTPEISSAGEAAISCAMKTGGILEGSWSQLNWIYPLCLDYMWNSLEYMVLWFFHLVCKRRGVFFSLFVACAGRTWSEGRLFSVGQSFSKQGFTRLDV